MVSRPIYLFDDTDFPRLGWLEHGPLDHSYVHLGKANHAGLQFRRRGRLRRESLSFKFILEPLQTDKNPLDFRVLVVYFVLPSLYLWPRLLIQRLHRLHEP